MPLPDKTTDPTPLHALTATATTHYPLPTTHYFPLPHPEGTPAVSSGLTMHLGEVDVLADLALGELEAVLELGDLLLEQEDAGLGLVGAAGAGDLGIAELPLEGREQVHRVAAAVGPGDLALLLAEERGVLGLEVGVRLLAFGDEVRRSGRRSGRRNRRRPGGSGG